MRGQGKRRMLILLAAVVVLTGSLSVRGAGCNIEDGNVSSDCLNERRAAGQQLVTAKVPLNLRVQWGHAHGYCGETSVQMVAAHHGVWVGQQLVRDLNGGELLVDTFGSVEKVLDTLGFTHTTWSVPTRHKLIASSQDYSKHASMLMVWMKQNIAQGRVPIFGAKFDGAYDPEYDHIMPAYAVMFWSNHSSSAAQAAMPDSSSPSSLLDTKSSPKAGFLFDGIEGYSLPANLSLEVNSMWDVAAAAVGETEDDEDDTDDDVADIAASTTAATAEVGTLQDAGDNGSGDLLPTPQSSMALFIDWESTPETLQGGGSPAGANLGIGPQPVPVDNSFKGSRSSQPKAPPPAQAIPPHTTGWLASPQQRPELAKLPGLYAFNATDILVWTNDYGSEVQRHMNAQSFFATRSSCKHSELAGGCFSIDSASYAVAMGGLVQPQVVPAAGQGQAQPLVGDGVSLAAPAALFRPMKLKITAWSKPGEAADSEPLARFKATAIGYELDVSLCAPKDQPFTVFRFDSYLAFRSTGKRDGRGRPVLANPSTVQELSQRCTPGRACRHATFVQTGSLDVGVQQFGPFDAYGSTYFVCVAGAVPATAA